MRPTVRGAERGGSRWAWMLVPVALATALAGCSSISASSESSSTLASSPSASSGSSSPEESYQEEVRDFTAANVKAGGTADTLLRQIGTIAQRHGITNWEADPGTYTAIGAGLAKAGQSQATVDAYKANLTRTAEQAALLQKGYDAAR